MNLKRKKKIIRYYEFLLYTTTLLGIIMVSWLVFSDKEEQTTKKLRTINFILAVAPKLMVEEDFIKLHSLINGRGALDSCLLNEENKILVRTTGSNCNLSEMDSYTLIYASRPVGYLLIDSKFNLNDRLPIYLLAIVVWTSFIVLLFFYKTNTQQVLSINYLIGLIKKTELNTNTKEDLTFFSKELLPILDAINQNRENIKKQIQLNLANQVAHDIRSPLAALEMISTQLSELSEDRRLIIRNSIYRIRDIANSLSPKKIEKNLSSLPNSTKLTDKLPIIHEAQNELLISILDEIITEKRLQYRDKIDVQIIFNQTNESYGLFSILNAIEFKRILSNIINNSIEALKSNSGQVIIELSSSGIHNLIKITDNGQGIPKNLLDKLGSKGATFNKIGGSGLGLYHAKSLIESWNGHLKIASTDGSGTIVTISLPSQKTPNWFISEINLNHNSTVVVFDDDQSIHQIWAKRFELLNIKTLKVQNLSTPNDFRDYLTNLPESDDVTFLMDYEILNHKESGLDLIEEFGIQKKSVLVTSRFEEQSIRERCKKLGISLLPKSMTGFVPLKII